MLVKRQQPPRTLRATACIPRARDIDDIHDDGRAAAASYASHSFIFTPFRQMLRLAGLMMTPPP